MLDKAIRDLDRERMGLQNQEKKLVAEIKKTAKQGQMVLSSQQGPLCSCELASWDDMPICHSDPVRSRACSSLTGPLLDAGCCEGHGKVTCKKSPCRHKDVWAQVSAAGGVPADCGEPIYACALHLTCLRHTAVSKKMALAFEFCSGRSVLRCIDRPAGLSTQEGLVCHLQQALSACADSEVNTGDG